MEKYYIREGNWQKVYQILPIQKGIQVKKEASPFWKVFILHLKLACNRENYPISMASGVVSINAMTPGGGVFGS